MNKVTVMILGVLVIVGIGYFLIRGNNQVQPQTNLEVPAPGNENVEETVVNSTGTDETIVDSERQSEARKIDIVSRNFSYDPEFIETESGETIVINFQNSGIHTFTIDELGIDEPLSGDSVIIEFTPERSGSFEYYCAIPGHKEQGMVGELIVN